MYQAGKPALLALAAVLLVTATGATAPAASVKLSPAQESAETRFVLFALEDLFRTTWADPLSVGDGRAVRAFIAQRERIVDDLSHRVRDAKLGRDRNTELIEALELYMKSVRDHGEKYAADLDKVIDRDGALKKWVEIHKRVDKEADPTRYVVATQVNAAALDYLRRPDADPFGMFATAFLGMMAEGRIRLAVQAKAWDEFRRNYLTQARQRYDEQQPKLAEALVNEMKDDLDQRREAMKKLAAALGGPRKWAANDTPFQGKPEDRTVDPFSLLHLIDAEKVTTDRGATREAADHLALARRYLKLVGMVPRPADNAFNFYRAVFYAQAGREANRAAALSVGANGFSARKGSAASRLAIDVWQRYIANSDRDVTPEVLHNLALALVYNGGAVPAYDTLKKASAQFLPKSPDFHYDVARLCSVAAEDTAVEFARLARTPGFAKQSSQRRSRLQRDTQRRVNQMLQDSSLALQRAVCCGFKDVERARETPDLKQLRAADARTLGRRRTFDQIVADRRTFEKVIENIVAGK